MEDDSYANWDEYGQSDASASRAPVSHKRPAPQEWTSAAPRKVIESNIPPQEPELYFVYAEGEDSENRVAMKTLAGEYAECGQNHGRKVFQKLQKVGPNNIDVLLYYWDGGAETEFTGWWFGNKLGGSQVWASCQSDSKSPPHIGWRIPWDGEVENALRVQSKEAREHQDQEALAELLMSFETEVSQAEAAASAVLEKVKAEVGDRTSTDGLLAAEKTLLKEVLAVGELLQQGFPGAPRSGQGLKAVQRLGSRLRSAHDFLSNEYASVKSCRQKVEQQMAQSEKADVELQLLTEMLPEIRSKVDEAEDEVEKMAITREMVQSLDDDETLQSSLLDADRTLKSAQLATAEAKKLLASQLLAVKRMASKAVRDQGVLELSKFQEALGRSQQRLDEMKNLREDLTQKRAAQKLLDEVEEKLLLLELAVASAEEVCSLLQNDDPSKDLLDQAQAFARSAEEHLNAALRVLDRKQKAAVMELFDEMNLRLDHMKTRQAAIRESMKEAGERISAAAFVREASEKYKAVVKAVEALEAIEDSVSKDDSNSTEVLASLRLAETSLSSGQAAALSAKNIIQMKLLEAKRFSARANSDATRGLQQCQQLLATAVLSLEDMKAKTLQRKCRSVSKEVELHILSAEALVQAATEAAEFVTDEEQCSALTMEQLREATEKALVREREASAALMEARKLVSTQQLEAKNKEWSAELVTELTKFQSRVASSQAAVEKQRRLLTSVDQRGSIKLLLGQAKKKIEDAEEKVAKMGEALQQLQALEVDEDAGSLSKASEAAASEAQVVVRALSRYLESQARSHSFAKDALDKLHPKAKELQDAISSGKAEVKKFLEERFLQSVLGLAEKKAAETTEALCKAASCESMVKEAFTSMEASGGAEAVGRLIADLEKAIQKAMNVVSSCRSEVAMQKFQVQRLDSTSALQAHGVHFASIEASSKALTDMRARASSFRRDLFQREAKVA